MPPAWSESEHQPSESGGAAAVAITRGLCSSRSGAKRRKSAARERDVGAGVAERPLERAEEAGEVVDVLVVEELGPDSEERAVDLQVLPVVALAQRGHEVRRLTRRERDAERVGGEKAGGGLGGGERLGHAGNL